MTEKDMNLGMIPGDTLIEKARNRAGTWGRTEKFSSGDKFLDEYLGGGYGRENGYEILTIFGDTGQNKSTLMTQMILEPALAGYKVAYLALEDDPEDVVNRIDKQIPGDGMLHEQQLNIALQNIRFLPENDGYTLGRMAEVVEALFDTYDIVAIDPIQFIFEASVAEKGETEFNRQRLFMRQMNNVLKKKNKTLILVSHTNKGGNQKERKDAGMFKIIGSSAIAQVSTKVLEIGRNSDGVRGVQLWKSRFTPFRRVGFQVDLTDRMRIEGVYKTPQEQSDARSLW